MNVILINIRKNGILHKDTNPESTGCLITLIVMNELIRVGVILVSLQCLINKIKK